MASTGEGKAKRIGQWIAEGGRNRRARIQNEKREKAAAKQKKIRGVKRITGKLGPMQKAIPKQYLRGQKIDNSPIPL